jgi:hypothetical protein
MAACNRFGIFARDAKVDAQLEALVRHRIPADSDKGAAVMVSFTDRVAAPPHVMVRFLDNECVFLNLETERYFGLDQTGTRMWQVLTAAPNIDAAYQQLLQEYDAEPEVLRANLVELLNRLVDNGLLLVTSSDVGTPSAV